jgi:hypothetical protein
MRDGGKIGLEGTILFESTDNIICLSLFVKREYILHCWYYFKVLMEAAGTIKEPLLRELIQALAPIGATVTGQEKGFAVVVKIANNGEKLLATTRGDVRLFASLDTAGQFIKNVGLPKFEVDMNGYEKGRLRKARPDRAEALRNTRTKIRQQRLFEGSEGRQ